jgi:hypothetical protein
MLPQNLSKFKVTERTNVGVSLIVLNHKIQGWHFDEIKLRKFVKENRVAGNILTKKVTPTFMGFISVNYQMMPAPQC